MLDVHPAPHAAHTWRDFVIHIATIVIGLLIAVGLEQTVEYFHHRQQVAEVRQQLLIENEINVAIYHAQTQEIRRIVPLLKRDLEVLLYLRQNPGAPASSWPGQLSWYYIRPTYVEAAWKSTHESGVLALLPRREVQDLSAAYRFLEELNEDSDRAIQLIWRSFSYGVRNQDPATMTAAQFDDSIHAVTDTITLYAHMLNQQRNLKDASPYFSPAPDISEMRKIAQVVSPAQDEAAALAIGKQMNVEIDRIQNREK